MPSQLRGEGPTLSRDPDAPKLRLVGGTVRTEPSLPVGSLDDMQLIAAVSANDAQAASAFHDRVRPQVDRTIFRLLGRRDVDHEDLVQLSLIELIYSVGKFRGDCSLDAWTSTIAAHVVYKHLRRRGTERRIFAMPPEGEPIASGSLPSADVVLRGLVARVRSHLDRISAAKAWAFILHDVCGYDLRESAKIMNVTVAAAQRRLVRGRRELHELIGADPELADWRGEMGK